MLDTYKVLQETQFMEAKKWIEARVRAHQSASEKIESKASHEIPLHFPNATLIPIQTKPIFGPEKYSTMSLIANSKESKVPQIESKAFVPNSLSIVARQTTSTVTLLLDGKVFNEITPTCIKLAIVGKVSTNRTLLFEVLADKLSVVL